MEKTFKDATGKNIAIGDTVVTMLDGYAYKLFVCTVLGFTAQKVRITKPSSVLENDTCLKDPLALAKVTL